MTTPSDFTIGQVVEVRATVTFGYEHNSNDRKCFREECEPFRAQITGARLRQRGTYVPADSRADEWGGDCDPAYIKNAKGVFVWEVRRGLTNKPLDCLPEDVALAEDQSPMPRRYVAAD